MGENLPALAPLVSRFQTIPASTRKHELQRLIGHYTDDAGELHRRALLMTALRHAGVYPGDDD